MVACGNERDLGTESILNSNVLHRANISSCNRSHSCSLLQSIEERSISTSQAKTAGEPKLLSAGLELGSIGLRCVSNLTTCFNANG